MCFGKRKNISQKTWLQTKLQAKKTYPLKHSFCKNCTFNQIPSYLESSASDGYAATQLREWNVIDRGIVIIAAQTCLLAVYRCAGFCELCSYLLGGVESRLVERDSKLDYELLKQVLVSTCCTGRFTRCFLKLM